MPWYSLDHTWDKSYNQWWLYHSFCFSSWLRNDYSEVWQEFMVMWVSSWCLRYIYQMRVWGNAYCVDFFLVFSCLVCSSFLHQYFCFIRPWCVRGRLEVSYPESFWVFLSWTEGGYGGNCWFRPSLCLLMSFQVCSHRDKSRTCPFGNAFEKWKLIL